MGMIYAPPSIIPNGALIDNVCHIYQSTKPTTRPDGSALVVGDRWYYNGSDAFWNGTYWLVNEKEVSFNQVQRTLTISNDGIFASFGSSNFIIEPSIFVEKVRIQPQGNLFSGNINATNKFSLRLYIQGMYGIPFITIDSIDKLNFSFAPISYDINQAYVYLSGGAPGAFWSLMYTNIVGSPSASSTIINLQVGLKYWTIL